MAAFAHAAEFPLSMWTSLYWDLSPEDALRHVADQGWGFIDLSAEHLGELWRSSSSARADAWRKLSEELGVTPHQCQLFMDTNLASADRDERLRWLHLLAGILGLAQRLGVGCAVAHPGWRGKDNPGLPDVVGEAMRESLSSLAPVAAETGVRIAVENVTRPLFGADPADLARLAESVDPERVGICYDSSHGNIDHRPAGDAIRACGRSLFCLHLSDNDGSGDQHRLPYEGTVDWPALLQGLRDIGYRGPLNFEVPALSPRPLSVRDAALPYLQHVMEYAAGGGNAPFPQRAESLADYCRQGWVDPKWGYP